jgi:diguanylate cyclase (GGDEF)-like protein
MGNVDYAVTVLWDLGNRQLEVDTHPILGDGRNGRIWLFNDVTAQRRLEQELRRLASTDPLTGLSNRRQFAEAGGAMLRQTRSDALALSVLMLDIDHFKSINDRYGHPAGDEVLQATAQRCRAELREQDLMARLGGEEFAVILPATDAAEAAGIAERLRAAIAAAPVPAEEHRIEVRVSIGGTSRRAEDKTLDELLGRADQALYTAKRTGRDRVIFA